MDKQKIKQKLKEKKVWMSGLGFLAALGVLSASQIQWVKDILSAVFQWG